MMFCPECGKGNGENNYKCTSCGRVLHPAQVAPAGQFADATIASIIPYKNPPALVSYYLGVFSLVPFVGIVLGIAAVILGLIGLRAARANPASGGKVHAWIGIVLGGLCALGYITLTILLIIIFNKP